MVPFGDCTRSFGESSSSSMNLSAKIVGALVMMFHSVMERVLCAAPSKLPLFETASPFVPAPSMNISQLPPSVYLRMLPSTLPPSAPWTKFEKKKAFWLAIQVAPSR
jgi:hypothetical protein